MTPNTTDFQIVSTEDVQQLLNRIRPNFEELGFEIYPFKVKWYNDLVASEYWLGYHDDTVALVVISAPAMFEKAFLPHLARVFGFSALDFSTIAGDPIDRCMQYYFDIFKKQISLQIGSTVEKIHDFELQMPYRRPKILLQTAAHISGAAYYYKPSNSMHRLGVCIHPEYGGWFGIRGAFVLKQTLAPDLKYQLPHNVIPDEEGQRHLLELFNEHWQDWSYRDVIPTKARYSELQKEYFTLKPRDRIDFIKRKILPILWRYQRIDSPTSGIS